MTQEEAKAKILNTLINCEMSLYTCLYAPDTAVVPISNIMSLNEGMTKYRAKQALKELIADGMVHYTSQGRPAIESFGEYRELVEDAMPPVNGYALTEKGLKSEEFKRAYEDWKRSMAEWANGHDSENKETK